MTEAKRNTIRGLGTSVLALALTACGGGGTTAPAPVPLGVSNLTGNFVFSAVGTDPSDGDYAVLGSFVADGKGNITSAVADYNLGSGVDENVPLTGTYTVSGLGAVVVNLTDGGSVKDTITTTLISTAGTVSAPISSFDGTGTGTLYAQVTTGFAPAGTYNFTVGGEGNSTVSGSGTVVAGSAGTFTSGSLTYQDGVTVTNYTNPAGFVFTPKANGRGQAALIGDNLSYYVIGPKQVEFIGLDARALLILPATKM